MRSAIGIVLVSIVLSFFGSNAEAAGIVYVNVNAPGPAQDGLSWNTGFRSLQVGLSVATPGSQIWVAKGTYLPTTTGDYNASFVLVNNVALYGGFAGTEPATFPLNFRNFVLNQTILSGAIGFPGFNSHHVVEAVTGTDATAIMDGFVVTNGNANSAIPGNDQTGGGMLIFANATPTITNCNFTGNAATTIGGSVEIQAGSPLVTFTNCKFTTSNAGTNGGGVDANSPTQFNTCSFLSNAAIATGGGLNATSPSTLSACTFDSNTANTGGGYNALAPVTISGSVFSNNSAVTNGGGLLVSPASGGTITTTTFVKNAANDEAGVAEQATVTYLQDAFNLNVATTEGGGIDVQGGRPDADELYILR